jgi:hypothetical protein
MALSLGIFSMQPRSDVVRMGPQHIGRGETIAVGDLVIDRWLTVRPEKTKHSSAITLSLPVFPQLHRIIAATPTGHLTFLVTKTGKSYIPNDFSIQFRKWCDEAGLPERCTFHGLRKRQMRRKRRFWSMRTKRVAMVKKVSNPSRRKRQTL